MKEGCRSWVNVIHIVSRLWAGLSRIRILEGQEIFLFSKMSRLAVAPRNPPIKWILTLLSSGVKWPGCETDHSSPSSAEVKNGWNYMSAPLACLHSLYRYNCTFY
jgi:hypothetical protein